MGHDRTAEVALEGPTASVTRHFPSYSQLCSRTSWVRADALARKFHETHDVVVRDELVPLLKDYGKLTEPWVFVAG